MTDDATELDLLRAENARLRDHLSNATAAARAGAVSEIQLDQAEARVVELSAALDRRTRTQNATAETAGLRVGIDLDGVCYDFAASLREHLTASGLKEHAECPDAQRWEFYEDWGLSLDEFLTLCHRGVEEGVVFTHGEPFPGTVEALHAMKDAGHTLHIVTDRSFGAGGASARATVAWLEQHGLPYDSLTFSADKTVVRLDAMVDDKPSNYQALTDAGVNAYLFTRPWNTHVEGAQRVASLAHFAEEIAR